MAEWWQSKPLPPGWEGKYDENFKRWFYIDHANKVTSWSDPRQKFYELSARQHQATASPKVVNAAHSQPAAVVTTQKQAGPVQDSRPVWQKQVEDVFNLSVNMVKPDEDDQDQVSQRGQSARSSPRPSPSRELGKSSQGQSGVSKKPAVHAVTGVDAVNDMRARKQSPARTNQSSSTNQPTTTEAHEDTERTLAFMRLMREFQKVRPDLIKDLLQSTNGSEAETRMHLIELGFTSSLENGTSRAQSPAKTVAKTSEPKKQAVEAALSTRAGSVEFSKITLPREVDSVKLSVQKCSISELNEQSMAQTENTLDSSSYDEQKSRTVLIMETSGIASGKPNETLAQTGAHSTQSLTEVCNPDDLTRPGLDSVKMSVGSARQKVALGPTPGLAKGPNKDMLINKANHAKAAGPDSSIVQGRQAKG